MLTLRRRVSSRAHAHATRSIALLTSVSLDSPEQVSANERCVTHCSVRCVGAIDVEQWLDVLGLLRVGYSKRWRVLDCRPRMRQASFVVLAVAGRVSDNDAAEDAVHSEVLFDTCRNISARALHNRAHRTCSCPPC